MVGAKDTAYLITKRMRVSFYTLNFLECLIIPIYKDQQSKLSITKGFLRQSNERILISEVAILSQKWLKIAAQKKVKFWIFVTFY